MGIFIACVELGLEGPQAEAIDRSRFSKMESFSWWPGHSSVREPGGGRGEGGGNVVQYFVIFLNALGLVS